MVLEYMMVFQRSSSHIPVTEESGIFSLNAHLAKFHLSDDPNCSICATPEDTAHILEECSKFRMHRALMHQSLLKIGINTPNSKDLLGGGAYDESTQWKIVQIVEKFLTSSGSLDLI